MAIAVCGRGAPVMRIELVPDLEHCIETRARREHSAAMSRILSGDPSPELAELVELLQAFLEEADFSRLRRESEHHLAQGRKVRFVLSGPAAPGQWKAEIMVENRA